MRQERESPPNSMSGGLFASLYVGSPSRTVFEPLSAGDSRYQSISRSVALTFTASRLAHLSTVAGSSVSVSTMRSLLPPHHYASSRLTDNRLLERARSRYRKPSFREDV